MTQNKIRYTKLALESAKKALREAGYDTHERSPGPGLYIANPAPDPSEYEDGTEPGGAWDEECDDLLAEIRAIVEPCECMADWDDDDIAILPEVTR